MSGVSGLVNIPELRKRILFTLGVLVVARLGVHIPTPGVDGAALEQLFQRMQGTMFGVFNMFTGGAFEQFSIFALGVMPYISASIIFELLTVVFPALADLKKEGDQGRKKRTQYVRYGTVFLCLVQGFMIASGLQNNQQVQVVHNPGLTFQLMSAITLTGGTIFLMWLGEQITERGIGNGISMIIFAGIAASIPSGFANTISLHRSGELSFLKLVLFGLIILATFFVIIFVERGARRIPVQYAKRIVGRKVYGGQNTNIPLKINTSGVIPPIFASSLIMFPATLASIVSTPWMSEIANLLSYQGLIFNILFVALIIFFCYFYTAIVFKTDDVADNLKKYGGFIPGIRPGPATAQYIDFVLSRITLGGGIYIAAICVLPTMLSTQLKIPFGFGGTSVLILVGVAMDTVSKVESFLLSRNYEGFMKHTRMKGRAGYT
jgi:preprotein translocase subunit SecY